jgi:glycosyltransferase involved in cell wall biosynthesis
MTTPATYAFGSVLGGRGIGRIAGHAVEGIHRAGLLDTAIAWTAEDLDIPSAKLRTVPFGRYVDFALRYYYNDTSFDYYSRFCIEEAEIFHGWNNMCLRTLRYINDKNGTTIVERASGYPAVQRELIESEYNSYGISESVIDDRLYKRAVAELREADAVFVPSKFVYNSFLDQNFSERKLYLIPFGVDVDTFTPPDDFGRSDEEFTALFVGSVCLRKGIQYLLPAWQEADTEGTLKIVGQIVENAQPIVEEYRDDPTIEFVGWVDDPAELYRQASVFVFPSIEDGFGMVVTEAMAAGLPAIVSENTGAKDCIREGIDGEIVPIRDSKALAKEIQRMHDNPDRCHQMGQNARSTVEQYTWSDYGDKVADVYQELLN